MWGELKYPIKAACGRVFANGCGRSVDEMRVVVVNQNDVNAYADSSDRTIGVHAGFLRAAGDDDEIAAVLAHEAAHLLFGHAGKKGSNALGAGLAAGLLTIVAGAAMYHPGTDAMGELAGDMFEVGSEIGRLAYSPEMELEADQFAMFVLRQANRRLTAGTDLIVRLHRGDVPAPVRRGEGWASYLATHPANDHRLAAMRVTLGDIRNGATRPLSKAERAERQRQRIAQQEEARRQETFASAECVALTREYPDCKWWQGEYDWLYITRYPPLQFFGHACNK